MSALNSPDVPRCLLVAVGLAGVRLAEPDLDELDLLARSAGFVPCARLICHRARADAALYIGAGKADEIALLIESQSIDAVVFDTTLGPIQQRNLNRRWGIPVLDRTEIILEIFSRRAATREGKLQVELAQLEHLSTRLVRGWTHLERQRGGIGGRGGPGEKQVELDRRMLGVRVKRLRGELTQLRRQRANRRRARERSGVFKISLVGYTNAGKSTLFNRLTGADTLSADQLFATLDTLSRKLWLPDIGEVMISDTVGFVRDLPHSLIEAFKATLEETAKADLLLHVIDASSVERREQTEQVEQALNEIDAGEVPILRVFNKADLLDPAQREGLPMPLSGADRTEPCDTIRPEFVSSLTGFGMAGLRERIAGIIAASRVRGTAESGDCVSLTAAQTGVQTPAGVPDPDPVSEDQAVGSPSDSSPRVVEPLRHEQDVGALARPI